MNKKPWAVFAALSAAILFVYGMTLGAPFVIDDLGFVRDNPVFDLPFPDFLRALFSPNYFALTSERTYQPLVTFLHWFIHERPFACHAAGLLIHALNAALVYLLCRRLKADERTSFFAALLFALYPASTEAVNVSSFKGHTLAFAFSAASLLLWTQPLGWRAYALALLSKETALIVPLLVILEAYGERRRKQEPLIAVGILTALYVGFRLFILRPAEMTPIHYDPLSCLAWYLKMFFAPAPLCLAHGANLVSPPLFILPALFFAGLWTARKSPFYLLSLIWILAALLPVLHLVPFREFNQVSDRYLYMASAGFCALAAKTLAGPRGRWALYALVVVWGGLTAKRNGLYRDTKALYAQTAACAPDVPQAQTLLGDYDLQSGDLDGARASYSAALALDPCNQEALENICVVQYHLGDPDGARTCLEKTVAILPNSARAHYNLGLIYQTQKSASKARKEFEAALMIDPTYQRTAQALRGLP